MAVKQLTHKSSLFALQREEEVAELAADLADVKSAYREQVEFLVGALEAAKSSPVSPAAAAAVATDTPPQ